MFAPFEMGLLLGLSIIISIGVQNLFVIKQGLRNEYPYLCAFMCFFCDVILIILGVTGVNELIVELPSLKIILLAGGVIFLGYYGSLALKRGFSQAEIAARFMNLQETNLQRASPLKLIILSLSFSLLNPQAVLDTTMIIGSNANHYNQPFKYMFVAGAIAASFCWFFGISFATRCLGKRLTHIKFWRLLEYISGFSMLLFALIFFNELNALIIL